MNEALRKLVSEYSIARSIHASTTDLDRLHDVELKYPQIPRGAGITFACCHRAVSAIELGEKRLCLIIPCFGRLGELTRMLRDVLLGRACYDLYPISKTSFYVDWVGKWNVYRNMGINPRCKEECKAVVDFTRAPTEEPWGDCYYNINHLWGYSHDTCFVEILP